MTGNISPFLDLPRELRDQIYRFILKADTPLQPIHPDEAQRLRGGQNIAIGNAENLLDNRVLYVNQQIFNEAYDILYTENTFVIRSFSRSFPLQRLDVYNRVPNLLILMGNNPEGYNLQILVDFLLVHPGLQRLEIRMAVSFYIWASRRLATMEPLAKPRYMEILESLKKVKVGKRVLIDVELLDGPPAPVQYQIYTATTRVAREARLVEFVKGLESDMSGRGNVVHQSEY